MVGTIELADDHHNDNDKNAPRYSRDTGGCVARGGKLGLIETNSIRPERHHAASPATMYSHADT